MAVITAIIPSVWTLPSLKYPREDGFAINAFLGLIALSAVEIMEWNTIATTITIITTRARSIRLYSARDVREDTTYDVWRKPRRKEK